MQAMAFAAQHDQVAGEFVSEALVGAVVRLEILCMGYIE
jgi:hypothetical protein